MVEDVEKSHLRFGRGNFLYVVDYQHINRLIEVDEIVLRVVQHRVGKLRFKHMSRNKEHTLFGHELFDAHANSIYQVGFSHPTGTIKKERVESALAWSFSNAQSHTAR